MTYREAQLHSFIIRVWKECAGDCAGIQGWRGQITHVPSGSHSHVKNMAEIERFMSLYLEDDSRRAGILARFRRRLAKRHLV